MDPPEGQSGWASPELPPALLPPPPIVYSAAALKRHLILVSRGPSNALSAQRQARWFTHIMDAALRRNTEWASISMALDGLEIIMKTLDDPVVFDLLFDHSDEPRPNWSDERPARDINTEIQSVWEIYCRHSHRCVT